MALLSPSARVLPSGNSARQPADPTKRVSRTSDLSPRNPAALPVLTSHCRTPRSDGSLEYSWVPSAEKASWRASCRVWTVHWCSTLPLDTSTTPISPDWAAKANGSGVPGNRQVLAVRRECQAGHDTVFVAFAEGDRLEQFAGGDFQQLNPLKIHGQGHRFSVRRQGRPGTPRAAAPGERELRP